jgi:hypothetical protein
VCLLQYSFFQIQLHECYEVWEAARQLALSDSPHILWAFFNGSTAAAKIGEIYQKVKLC